MLDKDVIQANLQRHYDNTMLEIKVNQDKLSNSPDLSAEELMTLYENQRKLDGIIMWITNVDKVLFPSSIVPVKMKMAN